MLWWPVMVRPLSTFQNRTVSGLTHAAQQSRKSPWRMSPTRKANQRKRMKAVDSVIDAIRQSGVQCKALVCVVCDSTPISASKFIACICSFRTAPYCCQQKQRCCRKTSTPHSARCLLDTESPCTECPSSPRYVHAKP